MTKKEKIKNIGYVNNNFVDGKKYLHKKYTKINIDTIKRYDKNT